MFDFENNLKDYYSFISHTNHIGIKKMIWNVIKNMNSLKELKVIYNELITYDNVIYIHGISLQNILLDRIARLSELESFK